MQTNQANVNRSKMSINIAIGISVLFVICCLCLIIIALVNRAPTTTTPSELPTLVPVETLIAGTLSASSAQTAAVNPVLPPTEALATAAPAPTNTSVPPTAAQNPNLIVPGTYLVGTDIQPGIYRGEAGADLFSSCYWAKLKDLSGNLDALLSNDNSIGQFYVEVQTSDFAFETRCEVVPLNSLPAGEFSQTIKAGMYIVGRDIQAGTYRGQAGADITDSCYWSRLSNVTGKQDSIIANDNAIGQFYVQVAPNDFALSTRCDLERIGD